MSVLNKTYDHISLDTEGGWNPTRICILEHRGDISLVSDADVKKVIMTLESKSYTPTSGDKLYFYPGCTVPRFKVRELFNPKGVSVTIKESNGTHLFISPDISNYIESGSYKYKIPKTELVEWLNKNKSMFTTYSPHLVIGNKDFDPQVKAFIDDPTKTHFITEYNLNSVLYNNYSNITGLDSYGNLYSYKPYSINNTVSRGITITYFKDSHMQDIIDDIVANPGKYYLDAAINTALSEECTIIDGDMYEQLHNLLDSSDETNNVMAMEILANCNISKSAPYIYRLFENHNDTMYRCKSWNSVNFKSLRDTTGLNRYNTYNDDNYITFVTSHGMIGAELLNSIKEKAKAECEKVLKRTFANSIDSGIVQLTVPGIKVILKGVNDGTETVKTEDPEIIDDTPPLNEEQKDEVHIVENEPEDNNTWGIQETNPVSDNPGVHTSIGFVRY